MLKTAIPMCGICAEIRFDGQSPDLARIERMLEAIARRGPDDSGAFVDGPVALGHRRLAVIDLTARAHQPMVDRETNVALTFNGTIYNYRALQAQLRGRGHRFHSESDTEVILKAYAEWGEGCAERLHGMFAFVLWDPNTQCLLMVRDRLGIKPLYFSRNDHALRVASSTQALLRAGGVDTRIDSVALHHHLTLHAVVPAPRTILRGVRKAAPATTTAVTTAGRFTTHKYWTLDATRPTQAMTDTEWIEATHQTLRTAVRQRLEVADVPVGVLLSGGLDSSLLVALLAECGAADIRTYSVGFDDTAEESGSEFEYSDQVAAQYATRHTQYRIDNAALLERLPEAVRAMAEPMVAQDAVAFFLLSERVSQQVKVVQSGQGADEVFGGYFWYPLMASATGDELERFAPHYFDRSHEEFLETVTPVHYGDDYTSALIAERLAVSNADTFMDQVLRMDVTMLVVDDPVKRVDNMTMAHGLEARVPFLDQAVVELAAQMPPALKLRHGGKYPLKAIARGRLPDAVIDRPKGYFPVPALKYIRGPFLELVHAVLNAPAANARNLFQGRYLERLLAAPDRHLTPIRGNKLWHAALLELWFQLNVDAP